jgi:hypothetical protein
MKTQYVIRGKTPSGQLKIAYIIKDGEFWFGR